MKDDVLDWQVVEYRSCQTVRLETVSEVPCVVGTMLPVELAPEALMLKV